MVLITNSKSFQEAWFSTVAGMSNDLPTAVPLPIGLSGHLPTTFGAYYPNNRRVTSSFHTKQNHQKPIVRAPVSPTLPPNTFESTLKKSTLLLQEERGKVQSTSKYITFSDVNISLTNHLWPDPDRCSRSRRSIQRAGPGDRVMPIQEGAIQEGANPKM